MDLAAVAKTQYPAEMLVCLATRETLYLDPSSITCIDLSNEATSSGLGHITKRTFSDLFHADNSSEKEVARNIRSADWLGTIACRYTPPRSVKGSRGPSWRWIEEELFPNRYARDPLLQIKAMDRVLAQKSSQGRCSTRSSISQKRRCILEHYNGSSAKAAYAADVQKCSSCLSRLKKGANPIPCLELASHEEYGDGEICKD